MDNSERSNFLLTPGRRRLLQRNKLLLGAATVLFCMEAFAQRSYEIVEKHFDWVRPESLSAEVSFFKSTVGRSDHRNLLVDIQLKFSHQGRDKFVHEAYQLLTSAGVQNLSVLEIKHAPQYQKLFLHYVRIHRGGATIDKLASSEIRYAKTEDKRYMGIYDDRATVSILVKDVRVGDIIEWAYTTRGDNPVMDEHIQESFDTAFQAYTERFRLRIVVPGRRPFYFKTYIMDLEHEEMTIGGDVEHLFRADRILPPESEDSVPDWYNPYPWIQITDFYEWREVASWASTLYPETPTLPSELKQKIDQWKRDLDEKERLMAAVRFVQEEIRYLGVESDDHTLVPHAPKEVFEKKFGDCKDKAYLLASILREMDLEAYPALVSTSSGKAIVEYLPSAVLFDHVIVKAVLDDKWYWIDPTFTYQRGSLEVLNPPGYGVALTLRNESESLVGIYTKPLSEPSYAVFENFNIEKDGNKVTLVVQTTHRGDEAINLRSELASSPKDVIAKRYLNFYASSYPEIKPDGSLEIVDNEKKNEISTIERYTITKFWEDGEQWITAWALKNYLSKPATIKRTQPLAVEFPEFVVHKIKLSWKGAVLEPVEEQKIEDSAISFHAYSIPDKTKDQLTLAYELKTKNDYVEVKDTASHLKLLDDVGANSEYKIYLGQNANDKDSSLFVRVLVSLWLGFIFFFGIVLLIYVLLRGKKRNTRHMATGSKKDNKPDERFAISDGTAEKAPHRFAVRPSLGQALKHTFKLWAYSFRTLLPAILAITVINVVPDFVMTIWKINPSSPDGVWFNSVHIVLNIPLFVVMAVAIFVNYDYANRKEVDLTAYHIMSVGFPRLLSMVGVSMLLTLICIAISLVPSIIIAVLAGSASTIIKIIGIFVGIAGAIPIVFFCVRWGLSYPVIVIEELKTMQSVKRSIELVKGKFFFTLGYFMGLFLIAAIASFGPYLLLNRIFTDAPIAPLIEAVLRFVVIVPFHIFTFGIVCAGYVSIYCALKDGEFNQT